MLNISFSDAKQNRNAFLIGTAVNGIICYELGVDSNFLYDYSTFSTTIDLEGKVIFSTSFFS